MAKSVGAGRSDEHVKRTEARRGRESENGKKACSKNGKRICKTFGKIRVCFRRNIPPCNPAGAEQIQTGAGRERV